ncbi:MAG: thrombospondin type 3 repeat-containing protein, partial [Actinobacteria bacterium]|nr:thrombospondin type 3 repeat-containing protein [Actinomycetota bacterium]
ELVPLLDGVRQIAFLQGETEMARFALSRRAPTVEIVEPAPGASWAAEGMATVVWEASDPDRNDALVYRVEASPDGSRWHVLASGLTETQATIDLSTIPGGGEGWSLRVQASDGFNEGADVVSPITIAPSLPQALILEPADRSFFGVGRTVSALGRGVDWADGVLPDAALTWEIDGRPAGEGTALEFDGLDAGEHTLTLRTTNAAGLTQTMEIRITVGVDTDGDGMPDEWELRQGLDYENPGDAARDVDGDTLRNWQEFNYGTNPTDADTDGDGLDDAAEIASGSDPLDPTSTAFDGHHGDTHTPYPTPRQVPAVEGAGGAGPSSLVIAAGVLVAAAIVGTGVLLLARRRRRASKVS